MCRLDASYQSIQYSGSVIMHKVKVYKAKGCNAWVVKYYVNNKPVTQQFPFIPSPRATMFEEEAREAACAFRDALYLRTRHPG
jgi:hypothetical protein